MGMITLTTTIPRLKLPRCTNQSKCIQPKNWQLGILFTGLDLLALGADGLRPCGIAFRVDQVDTNTPKGKKQLDALNRDLLRLPWVEPGMNIVIGVSKSTGYWQEPNPHESPVEAVATSPLKTKNPIKARQKRMIQNDNAPRQITWRHEEEIVLAKGWVAVSENNKYSNARKEAGFWCEVLDYMESKTKQYGRRTYDMVCGKWKTVRPAVVRFCGVYGNVMPQEYRQCQEDIRFYFQPYDHLTGEQQMAMDEVRAEIKDKYNLPY
ncbi:hypothetical protein Tco_1044008 [Tanacetum coccineum]|uniref:Myb-like domain-containing protein n=1 Tax=Tanacetum coccineum TaxID=301880 RepID=A0ABQ5GP11_9ASTR